MYLLTVDRVNANVLHAVSAAANAAESNLVLRLVEESLHPAGLSFRTVWVWLGAESCCGARQGSLEGWVLVSEPPAAPVTEAADSNRGNLLKPDR